MLGLALALFVLPHLRAADAKAPAPAAPGSDALLMQALVRKGILTQQEADDIRAEVAREKTAAAPHVFPGGKNTDRLSVGMRLQMQYANLDAHTRGDAFDPAPTQHAFLRRIYLTFKAELRPDWAAVFTYDFAGGGYDEATIQWKANPDLTFDFGLRKVNVAFEERGTSADLRSIERSGVTRYFVEPNNGRRLGAASYRVGAFMDGKHAFNKELGLVYSAAVTTPERNDTFTLASSSGDATNNVPALWANLGLTGTLPRNGTWLAGVGYGHLPDQGGFGVANLGRGADLNIFSVHVNATTGPFGLLGEYLTADVQRGRAGGDARPQGFFIQPSLLLTKTLEAIVRYQWLDTDGRGVTLADVVRSAPASAAMNTFTEWYAGVNWYLRGNDLKLQLGALQGETKETVTGAPAKARATGVRSQLQLQF